MNREPRKEDPGLSPLCLETSVAVVGAGPAGLMTALTLAQKGVQVLVLEKSPEERLGKPVRVSVEKDIFLQTGLPPSEPPEMCPPPQTREFLSPDGKYKLRLRQAPLLRLQLDLLVQRLANLAAQAGVEFLFETTITGPRLEAGKVTGVIGTTPDGRLLEVSAPLSIDATGAAGVLRQHLPLEFGFPRELSPRDLISAWQQTHEIDRPAVLALLERNRLRPQVDVIRLGFQGACSMLSIYVNLDADQVEITAGVLLQAGPPSGRELVEAYARSHHWIGPLLRGGGGLIPLRRPLDTFVAPGFACVGDAACQALPLHASGVASALAAGKILGEIAASAFAARDLCRASLWPYNFRYITARGEIQANAEVFRQFLLSLSTQETTLLFSQRFINEDSVLGSLEGLALEIPLSALLPGGFSLWRRPSLLLRLARLARQSSRALHLYAQYPAEDSAEEFERWRRQVQRLFPE